MHNYTTLDAVLNYVVPSIRKEASDLNLKSWALQAFRTLKVSARYINQMQIVKVENHKADLPNDMKYLNILTYLAEDYTAQDECELLCAAGMLECSNCNTQILDFSGTPGVYYGDNKAYCKSCDGCITESETYLTRTNNICRHTLAYNLWLDSNFYRTKFKPLKFAGYARGFNKHLSCDNCINVLNKDGDSSFTMDPASWTVTLNDIQEGFLCVNYQAEMTSESGDILIPDDSILMIGLANYASYMAMMDNAIMHEEGRATLGEGFLFKAEKMLARFRGSKILENINLKNLEKVIGTDTHAQQILRSGESFFKQQSGFQVFK